MRIDQSQPIVQPKVRQIKSDMRARMLGARSRVVQSGIGEGHEFLLTWRRGRSLMERCIPGLDEQNTMNQVLFHVCISDPT